jgi:hypothetical protein
MSKVFMFKKKLYSISDRNAFNEFVVVQFSFDGKNVLGAKVIPGKSEFDVEKFIRLYPFENFKNLPDDPMKPTQNNLIH